MPLNSKSSQLGILPPLAELLIPINPPMPDNVEPVVFCRPGDVIVTRPGPDRVVLRSTVDRVAGYVLVFAPSSVVRAARIPWADMARQAAAVVKTIMQDVGGAGPQGPKR